MRCNQYKINRLLFIKAFPMELSSILNDFLALCRRDGASHELIAIKEAHGRILVNGPLIPIGLLRRTDTCGHQSAIKVRVIRAQIFTSYTHWFSDLSLRRWR